MAKTSFFNRVRRGGSLLALIASALLLAACGQGDGPVAIANQPATPLPPGPEGEPFDSGLLTDGDFEASSLAWTGNAANVINDGGNLVNFADVAAAGNPFDVNLSQGLTLTDGETYTLTFKARSNGDRSMEVGIGLSVEPFTSAKADVNLTAVWQTFVFEFTAAGFGGPDSRVFFDMGADTGQVIIDDVALFAASDIEITLPIDPDAAIYRTDGEPDLVIPDDYADRTEFDSGSIIDGFYADDETFSPVLSVWSGTGSGSGANIAEVGFIGFPAGFLTNYESLVFKVKGMPNLAIFVKLFDGVDAFRLSLTSSEYSGALDDGWYQVSIPVAAFSGVDQATGIVLESDDSAAEQFRMLLTDIGFSGDGTRVPADPGIIPEVTLYDRDGMPDLMIPGDFAEVSVFGSQADVDDDFNGDLDFAPALAVTTGFGYDKWNAQLAYFGFEPGFATAYETLQFKVKDLSGDVIRVKLLDDPSYVDINVTTSDYSTELGNGWYQVSVPIVDIPGSGAATGLLFETIEPPPAESFTYLLTDIGFDLVDDTGGGGPGPALLTNGDFEANAPGKDGWIGAGDVVVNNYYEVFAPTNGQAFVPNLSQVLPLTTDADYVLTFRARASVARDIIAGIGKNVPDFENDSRAVALTTEWQTFTLNLNAFNPIGTAESRVLFDMGNFTADSTINIDDVSLALASAPDTNLLTNGDFQAAAPDKTGWIGAGDVVTNNYYTVFAPTNMQAFVPNLSQVLPLTTGADYTLTFRARASVARDILAGIGKNVPDFENDSRTVALTTEWQTFTLNLNAFNPIGTAESRVLFDMGNFTADSTINIDDVSLTLAGGGGP